MKGLVHIYTGNGKGKTTAALGLLVRALGCELNVYYTQFLKNGTSSEFKFLNTINRNLVFGNSAKINKFTSNMTESELAITKDLIIDQFTENIRDVKNGRYNMVIFDELINVVAINLLPISLVTDFIKIRPESLEVVMTGRNAPDELIEVSDYVSDINEIKHPYRNGIQSRKGIEF